MICFIGRGSWNTSSYYMGQRQGRRQCKTKDRLASDVGHHRTDQQRFEAVAEAAATWYIVVLVVLLGRRSVDNVDLVASCNGALKNALLQGSQKRGSLTTAALTASGGLYQLYVV